MTRARTSLCSLVVLVAACTSPRQQPRVESAPTTQTPAPERSAPATETAPTPSAPTTLSAPPTQSAEPLPTAEPKVDAPAPGARASLCVPNLVPQQHRGLVDRAQATRALAAYRAQRHELCTRANVEGPGLEVDDCAARLDATVIATGHFFSGADEAVIEIATIGDSSAGSYRQLILMRVDADGYRYVDTLRTADGFRARARIATPSGRDALFVCDEGGRQGVYYRDCEFLRPSENDPSPIADRIRAGWSDACGPIVNVELKNVRADANAMHVDASVEVVHAVMTQPTDESAFVCRRARNATTERFTVRYTFHCDDGRYHMDESMPDALREAIEQAAP